MPARLPKPSVGGAQVGDGEEGHEDGDVALADAPVEGEVHGGVAEEVVYADGDADVEDAIGEELGPHGALEPHSCVCWRQAGRTNPSARQRVRRRSSEGGQYWDRVIRGIGFL